MVINLRIWTTIKFWKCGTSDHSVLQLYNTSYIQDCISWRQHHTTTCPAMNVFVYLAVTFIANLTVFIIIHWVYCHGNASLTTPTYVCVSDKTLGLPLGSSFFCGCGLLFLCCCCIGRRGGRPSPNHQRITECTLYHY